MNTKLFAVAAMLLAIGLLVSGCAKAPTTPADTGELTGTAEEQADTAIDSAVVEDDTVELGELV